MPNTIGRYQIKSKLGQGGMAAVYYAFDPAFQREVAVKVLPPEFLRDPTLRARFEREARMIAGLEHSAIVPVYDVGEEAEQPYLVMRYMPGGALSDRLENGPIPVNDIARIIQRIGSALDKAHERGIIHRDLKPGNILFDQYGDAYLSDFGIARSVESQGTLTGYGGAIGTPGYMSPEQIQGDPLDNRSDIYALGIVAFEMLTGTNPFRSTSPAMSMVKQMTEALPSINQVKPDLPPEVDAVIRQATAKEPDDRTPTAAEVARLLADAMAIAIKLMTPPEPPPTRPQTQPDRTVLSPRTPVPAAHSRNTTWLIAGAAIILILAFIAYFAFTSGQESQPDVSAKSSPVAGLETVIPVEPTNTSGATPTRKPQPQPTNTPPLAATSPIINTNPTLDNNIDTPTDDGTVNDIQLPPISRPSQPDTASADATKSPTIAPTATPSPVPTATAVQAHATATPQPTATNTNPTLYDNFDDPAHDGTVNPQLWRSGSDTPLICDTRQENGSLITTNEPDADQFAVCWTEIRQDLVPGRELKTLSAQMKLAGDHNRGGISSIIRQLGEHHEIWCGFGAAESGAKIDFVVVDYRLGDYEQGDNVVLYIKSGTYAYDQWYTVRVEVDPDTMTFACLIDGEEIGRYTFSDVTELQNESFHWRGLLNDRAPGAVATTYIDDFRIEPRE